MNIENKELALEVTRIAFEGKVGVDPEKVLNFYLSAVGKINKCDNSGYPESCSDTNRKQDV